MKQKLQKLAKELSRVDPLASEIVYKMAGRYDKSPYKIPIKLQPAYKYIMYFKLFKGIDDETFHKMKRKYIDTSEQVQKECAEELDKTIIADAAQQEVPSSTVRRNFLTALSQFENQYWNDYFNLSLGKRSS